MKRLSVIIVTYNSEKDIYACLEAVFKYNDIGDGLEVIVVDNASAGFSDMKQKINEIYGGSVKVISNATNGGYGQGNNVGVNHSTADKLMIMNPDVRVVMPMFSKISETLDDGDTAMCGFKSMENETQRNYSFFYIHSTNAFRKVVCWRKLLTDDYKYKRMFFSGACFAIRKDVFIGIGMFDENIFLYGEENDIHFRLRKKYPDKKIVFLKDLRYIHPTENDRNKEREYKTSMKSLYYFYTKNGFPTKSLYNNEMRQMMIRAIVLSLRHPTKIHDNIQCCHLQRKRLDDAFAELNSH